MDRNSKTAPRMITASEREGKALRLRMGGLSFAQIANELGCSKTVAFKAVNRALKAHENETKELAETYRQRTLLQLEALQRALWPYCIGIPSRGIKPDVKRIDRWLKVTQELTRLKGVEPPQRVEVYGSVDYTYRLELSKADKLSVDELARLYYAATQLGGDRPNGSEDAGDHHRALPPPSD